MFQSQTKIFCTLSTHHCCSWRNAQCIHWGALLFLVFPPPRATDSHTLERSNAAMPTQSSSAHDQGTGQLCDIFIDYSPLSTASFSPLQTPSEMGLDLCGLEPAAVFCSRTIWEQKSDQMTHPLYPLLRATLLCGLARWLLLEYLLPTLASLSASTASAGNSLSASYWKVVYESIWYDQH